MSSLNNDNSKERQQQSEVWECGPRLKMDDDDDDTGTEATTENSENLNNQLNHTNESDNDESRHIDDDHTNLDRKRQCVEAAAGAREVNDQSGAMSEHKDNSDDRLAEQTSEENRYVNVLKGNRPDVHKVEICWGTVVPDGYYQKLFNALLGNTFIAELVLDVWITNDWSVADQDTQSAPLIEFVRTSTALRKVRISTHILLVRRSRIAERLASLIFDAIAVNSSIQELDIEGYYSRDAFHRLMSTSTSLKSLHVLCNYNDKYYWRDRHDLFLNALSSNHSIDNLSLTIGEHGTDWLEEVLLHIGNGPSTLQSLTIECPMFLPQFYNLLCTTTSLHTLALWCHDWEKLPPDHQTHLQSALATNTSIVQLKLVDESTDDYGMMIDNILGFLHNGPSTLRRLSLSQRLPDFDALQRYLCSSSAAMLQHLQLEECSITVEMLDCLIESFRARDSSPSTTSAIHMEMKSCRIGKDATLRLVEFLGACSNYHNCCHRYEPPAAEWRLHPRMGYVTMVSPAPELENAKDMYDNCMEISMLTTAPPHGFTSTPSRISLLSLRPKTSIEAFCDALTAMARMSSSLVCLQLSRVQHGDSLKLASCLSHLISLRELHMVNIHDSVIPATLLQGLRNNGSLLTATFVTGENQPFFEAERHRTLVQAYGQRNRYWSKIILKQMMQDDDTIMQDQITLLPTLFHIAARDIPRTKSWFITAALVALDTSIGEQRQD